MYQFLLLEPDDDKEDLDLYIPEDCEMESQCNQKMAQRIQTAILQDLRQTFGVDAMLPEEAAKDLILQVTLRE